MDYEKWKLDPASSVPLWAQLAEILRKEIEENRIVHKLPSEPELQERFGVSRATVREAIRHLRTEGYLHTYHGKGTFVISATKFDLVRSQRFSIAAILADSGIEEISQVLEVRHVEAPRVAARLRSRSDKFVLIERLRGSGNQPVALERAWVVADVGSALFDADLSNGSIYEVIERKTGITVTSGSDELSATLADDSEANLLGIDAMSPILVLEREGFAWLNPIEFRRTLLVPNRIRFKARWGR
jgi:GntR family transcriptional regulator